MNKIYKYCLFISLWWMLPLWANPSVAPIPATELWQESVLSQLKFSPDGKHLAVAVHYPDGKGLALYDQATNQFELIVQLPQHRWVKSYHWLDNEHVYLVTGDQSTTLNSIVTVQQQQGKLKLESKNVPDSGYLVGQLNGYPTQLLFAVNVGRSEVEYKLYKVNIEQLLAGEFRNKNEMGDLLNSDEYTRLLYSTEFDRLLSWRIDQESKLIKVHYRGLKESEWQPLFEYDPTEFDFKPINFINEGELAVLTNKNSDRMALYRFDLKQQKLGELIFEHPRYDLSNAYFRDGQLISLSYFAHGRLEQQFFSHENKKLQSEIAQYFTDEQWVLMDSFEDTHVVFVFAATNPGQYFLYTPGKPPSLIGGIMPKLSQYKLAPSIHIQVKNQQNMLIDSFLTLPTTNSANPPPLIVMPHGGPIGVMDTDTFDPTVQFLASRGYAVLRTNFRGSAGYGKSFEQQGVAELGEGIEHDIRLSVAKVTEQYGINKACAMGFSYGGYSAMMLAMKDVHLYRCIVAGYGIYDLPLLFNASNMHVQPEKRSRVERVIGPFNPGLKNRSPVYLADHIQAPSLIIAGMEDDIAGFEQSHRMADALKRAGKVVQEMYYQETGHGHDRWDLEHHQYGLIEQFLASHLKAGNILTDEQQAEQWYRHAQLLAQGDKLDKDKAEAIKLLQQAADRGHTEAQVEIAQIYVEGRDLPRNLAKGLQLLQKAAQKKSSNAELYLGKIYSTSIYTARDDAKSLSHYRRSAELSPENTATIFIARAACLGLGRTQDWNEGLTLLENHIKRNFQHYADSQSQELLNATRIVVSELLIDGQPDAKQRQRLIAILQKSFLEPMDHSAEVYEARFGLLDSKKSRYVAEQTYPISPEAEFGSIISVARGNSSLGHKAAWLLVRWERELADGSSEPMSYGAMLATFKSKLFLHYKHAFATDKRSAVWKVKVFDLDGIELYQQQFKFVAEGQ